MKQPIFDELWPDSWKTSYAYDGEEVFGEHHDHGYANAYDNRRRHTLRLLTEVLAPGASILDVAAAQGNFSLALAEMGYDVTWNDLRGELVGYVRLKTEAESLHFLPGNIFELEFPARFDGVLITEVIEHVAHPDAFLAHVASLVKPGGYVVMTTPNGAYFLNRLPRFSECPDPSCYEATQFGPNSDGHIFLLHSDEFMGLAAHAGLLLDRHTLFTNPLTAGHLGTRFVLPFLPKGVVKAVERLSQGLPSALRRRLLTHSAVRFRRPSTP
jgi:2-polyprenyl-3-methyl-5-hydroxy-6-metoxy-1,4-benzoquinol methylase